MTIDEFIKKLEEVPYEWELRGKKIRVKRRRRTFFYHDRCPITAICKHATGARILMNDFDTAADKIGLSRFDADRIVSAADYHRGDHPELRTQLLEAVGLTDKEEVNDHR